METKIDYCERYEDVMPFTFMNKMAYPEIVRPLGYNPVFEMSIVYDLAQIMESFWYDTFQMLNGKDIRYMATPLKYDDHIPVITVTVVR